MLVSSELSEKPNKYLNFNFKSLMLCVLCHRIIIIIMKIVMTKTEAKNTKLAT